MKVKNVTKSKEFTPINLEIKIESLEDFKALWHRLNVPTQVVRDNTDDMFNDGAVISVDDDTLWGELSGIAKEKGWIG